MAPLQDVPQCVWCRVELHADGDVWRCPQCDWRLPAGPIGICPSCLGKLQAPDADECRICESCGTEVWPPRRYCLTPSIDYQLRDAWLDEQRYKRSISKPGGGSSSSRRTRKKEKGRRVAAPWVGKRKDKKPEWVPRST